VLAVAIHNHYKRIEHEMEAAQAKQQAEAQVRIHCLPFVCVAVDCQF
jgi:ATP-dependent protease Clp ATPase subunit